MLNLKSLFVWVPSTVEGFNGAAVSAENTSKIYFESATGKIWVQGVSFGFNSADIADVAANIEGLTNAVTVLNGDANVTGSVAKAVKDAVDSLLGGEGIAETYDTIKEIAEWIAADTTRAANLAKTVADNTAAIEAEKTRAEQAESDLADRIEALEKDTADADALDAEIARAKAAEKVNADAIAAEVARATEAEEANEAKINNLKDEVVKNEEVTAAALNDHQVRILKLEDDTTNADAIAAEKTRAEGIEKGLADRIEAIEGVNFWESFTA